MSRPFQNFLAKLKLFTGRSTKSAGSFRRAFRRTLRYPEFAQADTTGQPELPPYSAMAAVWHDYARFYPWNYPDYLTELFLNRGSKLHSVLDLACGSGTLTARLAAAVPDVTGVDVSEAMLAEARKNCAACPNIRWAQGDFRHLQLGRTFDAATCAFNSLNYVNDLAELRDVFRGVSKHLAPGGLFVFDTLTSKAMRRISGLYLHVEIGDKRFVIRFDYDAEKRRETSKVLLPAGVEIHRRIPIDPADVEAASRESGLVVEDFFSNPFVPGRWCSGLMCFYLMRRA